MRIAICDRRLAGGECLLRYLQAALCDTACSYSVRQYTRFEELLCDVEEGEGFDIVFADVEQTATDRFAPLYRLREKGCSARVVLTAKNADLAVDGYEAGVAGFLVQPFDRERVKAVLSRLVREAVQACLTVRHHRTITRVPYHEILFVESRNTKCIVHCRDAIEHVMYTHLDDIESRLTDRRFLRCHQSYLVNMDHIVRVDTHFEMSGGFTVSIRQRERKRIREHYLDYLETLESMRKCE